LAVLALPKRINVLITYADNVVKMMTGNAYFPSPLPGAAATRNAKRALLGEKVVPPPHRRKALPSQQRAARGTHRTDAA
jgi:hypothetical protein